jgi:hypothetical protein
MKAILLMCSFSINFLVRLTYKYAIWMLAHGFADPSGIFHTVLWTNFAASAAFAGYDP